MLRVHVLADGRIGDVLVEHSAGHPDLDQAAMEAVRRWRFEPARRGADAVAMWVLLPVEFRLGLRLEEILASLRASSDPVLALAVLVLSRGALVLAVAASALAQAGDPVARPVVVE